MKKSKIYKVFLLGIHLLFCSNLFGVDILSTDKSKGYIDKYKDYSIEDLNHGIHSLDIKIDIWNLSWWNDVFPLKVELARRGVVSEREMLFKMTRSDIPNHRQEALFAMEVLADREAVFYLGETLKEPLMVSPVVQSVNADGSFVYVDDVLVVPAACAAAFVLSKLIKDFPEGSVPTKGGVINMIDFYNEKEIMLWREWWQQIRPQFSEFFPNDEK
jgi:hypothetical protein